MYGNPRLAESEYVQKQYTELSEINAGLVGQEVRYLFIYELLINLLKIF